MYVTAGQYKGRKIVIPDCAKPTLSKTRESVFNVLFSYYESFEGLLFLDLFAGSGAMTLEALSRGFETVSVDKSPKAVKVIKNNLKIAKSGYSIVLKDAAKFIETTEIKPDVIYIDPPWNEDYKSIIEKTAQKFKDSMIVIEYDKKRVQEFHEIYAKITAPFKEKVYGRCKLDFIKQND